MSNWGRRKKDNRAYPKEKVRDRCFSKKGIIYDRIGDDRIAARGEFGRRLVVREDETPHQCTLDGSSIPAGDEFLALQHQGSGGQYVDEDYICTSHLVPRSLPCENGSIERFELAKGEVQQ